MATMVYTPEWLKDLLVETLETKQGLSDVAARNKAADALANVWVDITDIPDLDQSSSNRQQDDYDTMLKAAAAKRVILRKNIKSSQISLALFLALVDAGFNSIELSGCDEAEASALMLDTVTKIGKNFMSLWMKAKPLGQRETCIAYTGIEIWNKKGAFSVKDIIDDLPINEEGKCNSQKWRVRWDCGHRVKDEDNACRIFEGIETGDKEQLVREYMEYLIEIGFFKKEKDKDVYDFIV